METATRILAALKRAIPATLAGAFFLLSACDGLRTNIFSFRDSSEVPQLGFWPDPGATVYSAPQRVNIYMATRFRDWTIVYTTDPGLSLSQPDKWSVYDPNAGLTVGSTVEIRAIAYLKGTTGVSAVASAKYSFNVPTRVYVDPLGSDAASGTDPAQPLQTIQKGIDVAAGLFYGASPVLVCVRNGDYSESPEMKSGVIIRGSYDASWNEPADAATVDDSLVPTSTIQGAINNEFVGGSMDSSVPLHTLRFPAGLTASSGVEHFLLRAPSGGTNSAAALIASEGTRIFNCRLEGGNGSASAGGLWVKNGGVIVERSFLRGRTDASTGYAVGALDYGGKLDVRNAWIESGDSSTVNSNQNIGIIFDSGGFAGSSLSISAASRICAYGSASSTDSIGLSANGGTVDILGTNVISSGTASASADCSSIALLLAGNVDAHITGSGGGNIIMAGQALSGSDALFKGVSCGVAIKGTSPGSVTISGNEIRGGNSDDVSAGIAITGNVGAIDIAGNRIFGGNGGYGGSGTSLDPTGSPSIGITVSSDVVNTGQIIIERNLVWGGSRSSAGDVAGIDCEALNLAQPCIVRNNIIHGGGGGSSVVNAVGVLEKESSASSDYLYLLFNTIYAGGDGGTGTKYGVLVSSPGTAHLDMVGNIVDSSNYPLSLSSSAVRPRNFLYNVLYTPDFPTYGAFAIAGSPFGYVIVNSADLSDNSQRNADDGINPRLYVSGSIYPFDESYFQTFDFRLDGSPAALTLISRWGYDGLFPIPAGVFNFEDFHGDGRGIPYTPGAIESMP